MKDVPVIHQMNSGESSGAREAYLSKIEGMTNESDRFEAARAAAVAGSPDAIQDLIAAYQSGTGTEPDQRRAFEWCNKAAIDGYEHFYFELALMYRDGLGTAQNIDSFWHWMTLAANSAESGLATEAMYQLADAHTRPELGQYSPERTADWTLRMADGGSPGGLIQLAKQQRALIGRESNKESRLNQLKRAEKAESAAKEVWLTVKKALSDTVPNFTTEDLPEGILLVAEALQQLGRTAKSRSAYNRACRSAAEAIKWAQINGKSISMRLAEIMLVRSSDLEDCFGTAVQGKEVQRYNWLCSVNDAIDAVFSATDGVSNISPHLADSIYRLVVALRDGVGVAVNYAKYESLLTKASLYGSMEATYTEAIENLKGGDFDSALTFAERAASQNHVMALALHALFDVVEDKKRIYDLHRCLSDIWDSVDRIRRDKHLIHLDELSDGVVHYTDGYALSSMLGNGSGDNKNLVRMYSIAYMNDPNEGGRLKAFKHKGWTNPLDAIFASGAKSTLSGDIIQWRGRAFQVFISCFTREDDSLDLWRFYGRNGEGFSIRTPSAAFAPGFTQGIIKGPWARSTLTRSPTLYKVCYTDAEVKASLDHLAPTLKRLDKEIGAIPSAAEGIRQIVRSLLSELIYLYKSNNYGNEREIRAVEARALGDADVRRHEVAGQPFAKLFVETSPFLFTHANSKIVIGPKVDNRELVMLDLQHKLTRAGWGHCAVEYSKAPYR